MVRTLTPPVTARALAHQGLARWPTFDVWLHKADGAPSVLGVSSPSEAPHSTENTAVHQFSSFSSAHKIFSPPTAWSPQVCWPEKGQGSDLSFPLSFPGRDHALPQENKAHAAELRVHCFWLPLQPRTRESRNGNFPPHVVRSVFLGMSCSFFSRTARRHRVYTTWPAGGFRSERLQFPETDIALFSPARQNLTARSNN